jgi:hypothetical protein
MQNVTRIFTLLGFFTMLGTPSVGQRFLPVGSGVVQGGVFGGILDMVEYEGRLVIGGVFPAFNGHERRNLQAWDGTTHDDLGDGFTTTGSRVRRLLVHEGNLIAAGLESSQGRIRSWDGNGWTTIGADQPAEVLALCAHEGGLYIGGAFNSVKRWNGTYWETIGQHFNERLEVLAVHEGVLYAGGRFTAGTSGDSLRYLAYWNGETWSEVAAGLNARVQSLVSMPGGLLIGGQFTAHADGTGSFQRCAKLDPSGLHAITLPEDPGFVAGFSPVVGVGLFVHGMNMTYLVRDNDVVLLEFDHVRKAMHFNGMLLLAGGGLAKKYQHPIRGIARLDLSSSDHEELDIARITPTITPTPALFRKWWRCTAGFEAPAGSGTFSLYQASPLLRAERDGVRYYSGEFIPFLEDTLPHAGPLGDRMDGAFYERYHQVWKVDRQQILAHLRDWWKPEYSMPPAIADWPAHGDVENGEPWSLAPFADLNDNDLYEPEKGEYPLIKGDQAIYHITHSSHAHFLPGPLLPVDMHYMTYAYTGTEALEHTVFLNLRIVNRSELDFILGRFGLMAFHQIGCALDDLAGCDTLRSMFYAYNGYEVDEDCIFGPGYGEQPPAQGIKFLNTQMSSHRLYHREGQPWVGPVDDLLDGLWNGSPFLYNGGPSHFQFPGGEHAEQQPSPAMPGRSAMGAAGPFTLEADGELCFDLAFIFARAGSGGPLASVEALRARADSIQAFHAEREYDCTGFPKMPEPSLEPWPAEITVYPNPASMQLSVRANHDLGAVSVWNAQGQLVMHNRGNGRIMELQVHGLANGLYILSADLAGERHAVRFAVER